MIVVTLEGDDGETFDVELTADSIVNRSLESKWESAQSPTPTRASDVRRPAPALHRVIHSFAQRCFKHAPA